MRLEKMGLALYRNRKLFWFWALVFAVSLVDSVCFGNLKTALTLSTYVLLLGLLLLGGVRKAFSVCAWISVGLFLIVKLFLLTTEFESWHACILCPPGTSRTSNGYGTAIKCLGPDGRQRGPGFGHSVGGDMSSVPFYSEPWTNAGELGVLHVDCELREVACEFHEYGLEKPPETLRRIAGPCTNLPAYLPRCVESPLK